MNILPILKTLIGAVSKLLGYRLNFGTYSFTLGAMFIGLVLISASATLLGFIFRIKGGD